jgi:hypothetical protein
MWIIRGVQLMMMSDDDDDDDGGLVTAAAQKKQGDKLPQRLPCEIEQQCIKVLFSRFFGGRAEGGSSGLTFPDLHELLTRFSSLSYPVTTPTILRSTVDSLFLAIIIPHKHARLNRSPYFSCSAS